MFCYQIKKANKPTILRGNYDSQLQAALSLKTRLQLSAKHYLALASEGNVRRGKTQLTISEI